jgi:hypothetical protein
MDTCQRGQQLAVTVGEKAGTNYLTTRERVAIMVIDGGLPHADAERLAWESLQTPDAAP